MTGLRSTAKEIVRGAVTTLSDRIAQCRNQERVRALLVKHIRSAVKAAGKPVAESEPATDLPGRVAALTEPSRTAFALFHCFNVESNELAELQDLSVPKFSEAVRTAREALDPSAGFPTCHRLALHRPWGKNAPATEKAVQAVKGQEAEAFSAQTAFDERCHAEIVAIAMPAIVPLSEAVSGPSRWKRLFGQPAVLAIVTAGLVVVGVVVYATMRNLEDFAGKDAVCELVDDADAMSGMELEPIAPIEAGKLGDWFLLKGFEDFSAPSDLVKAKAVGCRVYRRDGHPIAQVALDHHNALLLVFRAADLKVNPATAGWRIFQQDDWAVAAKGDGRNCYVLAFLGDASEMESLLKTGAQ